MERVRGSGGRVGLVGGEKRTGWGTLQITSGSGALRVD